MADFIKTQNSFSNGEVAPEFYANDNIKGLSKLENMDVLSGGGLSRRAGLRFISQLSDSARLISFSVSDTEEYIIAISNKYMSIFCNDKFVQEITTPWAGADVSNIQYAQRFGTMIFVHPDYPPYVFSKDNDEFSLDLFLFAQNDANLDIFMPYVRFDDSADVTITVSTSSQGNNYAVFTSSRDFWTPDNVGGRFCLIDRQWTIAEYRSPTEVVAYVNGTYAVPSGPITDWKESAFSKRRGWPCSITFHQDRLVFGGSRSWSGGIWMSQVGRHTNFDTGTGLDDEAIFVSLLSQQRQQICTVVSSDNLQILTNVGEWAISSKPLTPSSVDIKQHTSVGSYAACYLQPQKVEGATVFVSNNGRDIRELSLDELGEKYNANDLCVFAKHLMDKPTDIAYNATTRQMFVVQNNGLISVLNQNTALGISGWTTYKTQGKFLSVAVCNEKTYVVVQRQDGINVEVFDKAAMSDCEKYDFVCSASSVPMRVSNHNVSRIKLRKVVARVLNTKSVCINQHNIPLPNEIYEDASDGFSGDVSINLLGVIYDCMTPVWTVSSTQPYPTTILSITTHGWYTV